MARRAQWWTRVGFVALWRILLIDDEHVDDGYIELRCGLCGRLVNGRARQETEKSS